MMTPPRTPHRPRPRPLPVLRSACCLIVLALLLPAAATRADSRPASRMKIDDVVTILRHKANPTPADLARAGDDADRVLVDLMIATSVDPEVRRKAAAALGGYPGQRSRAVLAALIPSRQEPSALRAAAMVSLAKVARTAAIDDLRPFLKDPDAALRSGAARALAVIADSSACGLLSDALEHEEVLEVRVVIDEGTKACRKRGNP